MVMTSTCSNQQSIKSDNEIITLNNRLGNNFNLYSIHLNFLFLHYEFNTPLF